MESERQLIDKARRGDHDAFAALMRAHQNKVYSHALRMTGSREDANDLAQEVFVSAWRGLARFQGDSSLSTWLYRLTANAAIDFLRREKRKSALSMTVPYGDEGDRQAELICSDPTPDELAEASERSAAVQAGLKKLSPDHRQILLLREMNGLSYLEICDILGLEEGTVKSRLARARLALRKILLGDGNLFTSPSSELVEKR